MTALGALRAFASAYPNAAFVEIGANDGQRFDSIFPFVRAGRWHGVVVEPVPYLFERLRRTYGGNRRVAVENVAIGDHDGQRPFYHLAEAPDPEGAGVPWWYDAIGSFDREHVLRHARGEVPDVEDRIRHIDVRCMTLDSLCRKHAIAPDLLVIDAEGFDWRIIRTIDFTSHRPRLLAFEHHHLGPRDRSDCEEMLRGLGYELVSEGLDTWCLDTTPSDELSSRWGPAPVRPRRSMSGESPEAVTGRLEVACAARRDYVPHCATMLDSLAEQVEGPLRVHFLHGADVDKTMLRKLASVMRRPDAELVAHDVGTRSVPGLKTTAMFPASHWYRVFLPDVLPDVQRVIYLDADTIIMDPLDPLWAVDLAGRWVAAVTNVFPDERSAAGLRESLGLTGADSYFNSGVMVLNLDEMRSDDCSSRVVAFARQSPEKLFLPEQDAMNAVLSRRRLPLAPRWNCTNALSRIPWAADVFAREELREALDHPAIRHFEGSGANKPWHPDADPEARALYWRHRERTPWAADTLASP